MLRDIHIPDGMEQAYLDKLDGKIPDEFWQRKSVEWQSEESEVLGALRGLEQPKAESHVLNLTPSSQQ